MRMSTHFGTYVIKELMENPQVNFLPIGNEDKSPVAYKEITRHLVFGVKWTLPKNSNVWQVGISKIHPPS